MKDSISQRMVQLSTSKKALLAQRMRADNQDLLFTDPIAIIGMGCRFPGGADNPELFWKFIESGGNAISEIPPERWDIDAFYHPDGDMPGKMYTRRGGFLAQLDQFDPDFFGISPREAYQIDPQQRLVLEVAWEALESAGQTRKNLSGSRTGVFIGNSGSEYSDLQMQDLRLVDAYVGTGSQSCVIANRLSYILNLKGPSLTVDTACSSSLVAIHLACLSLRNGESDLVLAGGVNLMLMPDMLVAFSKSRILSPDGLCKTFDKDANGYVRGEGCGVVVLKRLADAIADNDPIHAVIRGTATNHNGKTNGLSAPSSLAQEQVIRQALANAMLEASQISFIEAHGTGTVIGDTLEFEALAKAYGHCDGEDTCLLGAVKTNIGHLEAAAGIAGIIKMVLCLQHRAVPPHRNFREFSPTISLQGTRFSLPLEKHPWQVARGPRRGAISSFGFGGSNAHTILEEAPQTLKPAQAHQTPTASLLPLSAHSPAALRALAHRYQAFLAAQASQADTSLSDLCYTAAVRRDHHAYRLAVTGETSAVMAEQLDGLLASLDSFPDARAGQGGDRKPVFVFSGQGQQWWGMGRELLQYNPVFRAKIEACDEIFQQLSGWSILAALTADEMQSRLDDTAVVQPAIFVLQVALAEVWSSWGIVPDAVVGHSVGEVVAAHVAGILSLKDALRVIYHRGRLMQKATGLGKMASVRLPVEQAQARLQGYEDRLAVAAVNDPYSTVIAGEAEALEAVLRDLQAQRIHCQKLPVNYAFHSPQMEPFRAELVRELEGLQTHHPGSLIVSTVSGREFAADDYKAAYWGDNVRQPVRFAAAIGHLLDRGFTSFVEISAHPVLAGSISQCLRQRNRKGVVVESLRRQEDERLTLLTSLGKLYSAGYEVDWSTLYPRGRCVPLPNYPFQRERYWFDQAGLGGKRPASKFVRGSGRSSVHPLLDQCLLTVTADGREQRIWEIHLSADGFYCPSDHRVRGLIIFPAAAYVDLVLSAAREQSGAMPVSLEHIAFHQVLDIPEEGYRTVQLILSSQANEAISFQIFSRQAGDDARPKSWTLHVTGILRRGEETAAQCWAEDAVAVQARCSDLVSREEHYENMSREGLQYGRAYQGVDTIWRRDGEALARVQATEVAAAERKQCQLHPTLLDACFQALSAATPATAASSDTYLPVAVGKLTLHGSPSGSLWAHVCLKAGGDGQGAEMRGEIDLFDQDGGRILEIRDYRVKRVNPKRRDFLNSLYQITWTAKPRQDTDSAIQSPHRGSWVLFADCQGVADALRQFLSDQRESCHLVNPGTGYRRLADHRHEVDPGCVESFSELFAAITADDQPPCQGVVFLWSLDDAPEGVEHPEAEFLQASQYCLRALHMVQALIQAGPKPMPRLWLVTRSAQPVGTRQLDVSQAPLWGLGRVIAMEHPELHCSLVDLHQADATEVASLFAELTGNDIEDQLLLRASTRYVARITRVPEQDLESVPETPQPAGTRPFRLELDRSGILDHLSLRETTRRPPGPGQIEIEVQTTGLNFLDVLLALGAIPDDASDATDQGPQLGAECAGRVVAVGKGVDGFVIGQRVAAIVVDGFATHVTTDARLATPIQDAMSFEEAATIPIVFLTAWQALYHTARLAAGERVLIHAGAGGVGSAAIQIAQYLGAEVFATAGTPEKREFLNSLGVRHVMDSRSLRFADQVMEYTRGEGVDVVLNSLAGEFIPRSLALLRSYGRFIEIGKRDYYENRMLGLQPFLKNLSFALVDLRAMMVQRPDHIQLLFQQVMALFERGALKPLVRRVFPIARVPDAFHFMAQAKHIGKIVVAMDDPAVPVLLPRGLRLRADATYLISGGLGGLGLRVAERLAQRGARHLVLLGRHAPSEEQREAIKAIEEQETTVAVLQGDVSREPDVLRVLAHIKQYLPPLRGVIHAAGVLDDGTLLHQNAARFQKVLAPKMNGAWHLHRHTWEEPLDFFVLFSSTASLTGSPGQANYTAANTFLDALVHYRHQRGRPGLSINWGPWSEVGMAAVQSNRGERLARSGLDSIDPERGLRTLEALLERCQMPQIGVMPMDWERWAQCYPQHAKAPLYSDLLLAPSDTAGTDGNSMLDGILNAPEAEREGRLQDYVLQELAAVLRLPKARLNVNTPIPDLGIDSLMVIELSNRIKLGLGLDILPEKITEKSNVAMLTGVLLEALAQVSPTTGGTYAPDRDVPTDRGEENGPHTADPDQLSDEQVDVMLQEMLESAPASETTEELDGE